MARDAHSVSRKILFSFFCLGRFKETTDESIVYSLLTSCYEENESWQLNAVAFDGNLYLEDHVPPLIQEQRIAMSQRFARNSYWGVAFEAYATEASPVTISREDIEKKEILVDTNEQWCCVVKSKIGDVRLYMGGEVDCVQGKSIFAPFRALLVSCELH